MAFFICEMFSSPPMARSKPAMEAIPNNTMMRSNSTTAQEMYLFYSI